MKAAAVLYACGLEGAALWKGDDPVEVLFLTAICEEVQGIRAKEREDLANRIINTLSNAMK